jgi:hypothetical protein
LHDFLTEVVSGVNCSGFSAGKTPNPNIPREQMMKIEQRMPALTTGIAILAMGSVCAHAGLVAHYEFEEEDLVDEGRGVFGVVQESTGNQPAAKYWAADGEGGYIAGVINQPGPGGEDARAYRFDRSNQYGVSTYEKALVPADGDFTIEVSFRTDHTGPQGHLVSNNAGPTAPGRANLYIERGELKWFHGSENEVSLVGRAMNVADGEWHVAAISRKGDRWELSLDGQVLDSINDSQSLGSAEFWMIGRDRAGYHPFDGEISDVKIYDEYRKP